MHHFPPPLPVREVDRKASERFWRLFHVSQHNQFEHCRTFIDIYYEIYISRWGVIISKTVKFHGIEIVVLVNVCGATLTLSLLVEMLQLVMESYLLCFAEIMYKKVMSWLSFSMCTFICLLHLILCSLSNSCCVLMWHC